MTNTMSKRSGSEQVEKYGRPAACNAVGSKATSVVGVGLAAMLCNKGVVGRYWASDFAWLRIYDSWVQVFEMYTDAITGTAYVG